MTSTWYQLLDDYEDLGAIASAFSQGISHVSGRCGSSTSVLVGAFDRKKHVPRLVVTAHLDQADEMIEELQAQGVSVLRFPALETLPGETSVRSDLLAERLRVVQVIGSEHPPLVVAPIAALMQPVPSPAELSGMLRAICPGNQLDRDDLIEWMDKASWVRAATVERPCEYAVRGDVLDIFPEVGEPVRVDLFGDEVESLHGIDLDTMGSSHKLERLDLVAGASNFDPEATQDCQGPLIMPALLDDRWEAIVDDIAEVREQARAYSDRIAGGGWVAELESVQAAIVESCAGVAMIGLVDAADVSLPVSMLPAFPDQAADAVCDLHKRADTATVIVVCQNTGDADRLREMLGDRPSSIRIETGYLHRGFSWHGGQRSVQFVPYHEIIHRYHVRRKRHGEKARRELDAFVEITPGDYVVHRDHGIAAFLGMQVQSRRRGEDESFEEFLILEFAAGARLLVPATGIDDVHRYIGAFKGAPERSMLGGKSWENRKERAADSVRDLAAELLRVQAVRQERVGVACPADSDWQQEFEAAFPWEPTRDQTSAFAAVESDMQHPRPMDRLVCGDVGFGKTEVAIRAAFRTAAAGRQTAILVPTTVLAEQHERTFRNRFAGYPFRVESMSRFKTPAQQREVLAALAAGEVDVLVGTHRLLSKDVHFKELGLVVIDEEQRFGVEHKQRLLQLRATVDVLTMTATPIPRTLHMSMMGLRDISSLQTAPVDRRAVVTEVMPWNEHRLRAALQRELAREGQVFVVHNRVRDLDDIAEAIRRLVPDAKVVTGHGQMSAKELESTMFAFMRHEVDILVATTIIESGIDIPNANTIIINEADRFGLADLHQLRGRVGRSRHRAYCYLLLPMTRNVRPEAKRRLQAVESFSMLGAGFRIALRDLELRGAGNLLGPEQSGHIAAVGYELYCRLLEQAVDDLKSGRDPQDKPALLDVGWTGYFPEAWIPGDARRLDGYRRLCQARNAPGIDQVMTDLQSAYGPIPAPAARLRACCELGVLLGNVSVTAILRRDADLVLQTSRPVELLQMMQSLPGRVRRVGEQSSSGTGEIWWRPPISKMTLKAVLKHLQRVLSSSRSASAL